MTPPPRFDSWDDGEGDDEYDPDDAVGEERDEETTSACPFCGEEIYEDAEWCPHCEQYLSRESAPRPPRSGWIWVGLLACFAAVLFWILFG